MYNYSGESENIENFSLYKNGRSKCLLQLTLISVINYSDQP